MKTSRRILTIALSLGLGAMLLPGTAHAAPETCYGEIATIPGATNGDDYLQGTAGDDVIIGRGGDDLIEGMGGNDKICGGPGDDLLDGGSGNDRVDGGTGDNTVSFFEGATGPVVADLADGEATGVGNDRFENVTNMWGSPFNDTLRGDGASNIIFGDDGDDEIVGRGGSDWILGDGGSTPGDDTLRGGSGFDYVSFAYSPNPVQVWLYGDPNGYATGEAVTQDDLFDFEGVIGSEFSDALYGGKGTNAFVGDPLQDGGGSYGNDDIYGGGGFDIMMYLFSPGPVDVNMDYVPDLVDKPKALRPSNAPRPADGETSGGEGYDWLYDTEAVIGSEFDDVFVGDHKANGFLGMGGDDTMYGYGKGDWLQGGTGDDWADGGAGKDVCKTETAKKCEKGTKSNLDGPMKSAAKAFRRH